MMERPFVDKDGSATANAALMKATLALDRMQRHEANSAQHWRTTVALQSISIVLLAALIIVVGIGLFK